MFASLVGVIAIWSRLGKFIEKNLHFLVSFSAGVFVIIAYGLIMETLEHSSIPIYAPLWIILGSILSIVIFKILPHFHHHEDNHEGHRHSHIDARRIMFSDAVHNIADGILLTSSFAVSTTLGITTTISVFVHEIIQELSEFFVLKQAGYSMKKALSLNFLVSSTILIGSIGGYFLLEKFEAIEAPLLGITAGAFLVIISHDLIPHSLQSIHSKKHIIKHVGWFTLGLGLMFLLTYYLRH